MIEFCYSSGFDARIHRPALFTCCNDYCMRPYGIPNITQEKMRMYYRMRLIAILSPTDKWGTKTEYARLRKFLLKDGYIRIGPEVFMRVVQNRKASEKHYRRIDEVKPKTGVVRLLRLTEKQYNNIYMVTGEPDYQEKTVGVNCHIMI